MRKTKLKTWENEWMKGKLERRGRQEKRLRCKVPESCGSALAQADDQDDKVARIQKTYVNWVRQEAKNAEGTTDLQIFDSNCKEMMYGALELERIWNVVSKPKACCHASREN